MAGNTRWAPNNDVFKHPEDSILLAYLRKQQLKDRLSISKHIDEEKCLHFLQRLNELKQTSDTLEVLGEMRAYQQYQELTVADTFAYMQRAASTRTQTTIYPLSGSDRQRPRKSVLRLISLPAAFGLAILFTVAMLVFANLSGTSWQQGSSKEGVSHSFGNTTVVVKPHSIPTSITGLTTTVNAKPSATAVHSSTSAATPTASIAPIPKPNIAVCSTKATSAQWHLIICGYNFDPTHRALLLAFVKKHMVQFNLAVDQHGTFQFGWNISNCSNLPTSIYALEMAGSKTIFVKLQISSFGNCSIRRTPTAGSIVVSTKI